MDLMNTKYAELEPEDVATILLKLPPPFLAAFGRFPTKLLLAGATIRNGITKEPTKDIDFFVDSADTLKALMSAFGDGAKWFRGRKTFYTMSMRAPIQIAHCAYYTTPEAFLADADFSIAQSCLWHDGTGWKSAVHPKFYQDVAAKARCWDYYSACTSHKKG